MAAGRPVTIYGDGSQSRDFTFIDDMVSGVMASLDNLT
jgi:nucleoside-diphosphate-sugar epimerase